MPFLTLFNLHYPQSFFLSAFSLVMELPLTSRAPDGGYGWVVVGCSFCELALLSGQCNIYGLLQPHLLSTFEAGEVYTMAIMSVMWGCLFGVGEANIVTLILLIYFY